MSVIQNKFLSRDKLSDEKGPADLKSNHYGQIPAPYNNNNIPREESYSIYKQEEMTHRKPTFLFWALVVFLFILAVGNLILTFIILGVLRLGQGMESLELFSEENLIQFYGTTDLDVIYKRDGHIDGFGDVPVEITGDADSVVMRLSRTGDIAPSIDVGVDRQTILVNSFEVKHPRTGVPIFSTEYPNFGLPGGVDKLDVQKAQTRRIASPLDSSLLIKSDSFIKLKGSEGTRIDGKEVVWSADQDIFLKSVNKSIILSGSEGVYVDIRNLPIANINKDVKGHNQYKICVCMPSGKLFRVPVLGKNVSCHIGEYEPFIHPCL